MKNSNIRNFAILALVLVVGFIFTNSPISPSRQSMTVFSNFDWGKVTKIGIQKGEESIEIAKESDDKWVIPSRGNYTANGSEITALTLKMADLSTSQRIALNEDGLKRLGLTEESKSAGQGSITFSDASGAELEKVYIGGLRNRKNTAPEDTASLAGQFIKRKSIDDAFLVATPVVIYPTLSTWLNTEVVNVADSEVLKVSSFIGGKEIFSLDWDDAQKKLVFKGTIPQGEVLQDTVVSQVAGGIKDVKMTDVLKADSDASKALDFNNYVVYTLKNGLVYKIEVAEKEAKKFIKVSVSFQADLPKTDLKSEPKPEASPASEEKTEVKEPEKNVEMSSKEEAGKFNATYTGWVYEVPDYVATRYLRKFEDLFKVPVETTQAPAPAGMEMTEG